MSAVPAPEVKMPPHKRGLGFHWTLQGGRWAGMKVRVDHPLDHSLQMGDETYLLTPTPDGKYPYAYMASRQAERL